MIDIATVEEYMRAANPIPTLDAVDADELAFAVAAVDTRRAAAMQAPTQHPSETATPPTPPPRWRRVWAFAAAFILILVVVGATALVLRSDDAQVTDEPAPSTTVLETPTSVVETSTTLAEAPVTLDDTGQWRRVRLSEPWTDDIADVASLPSGGFVVANTTDVLWSPDGVEWIDADPQRQVTTATPRSGTRDYGLLSVISAMGDRVVVLDGIEPGLWVGDLQAGEWESIRFDTADLAGVVEPFAVASNDTEVIVVAEHRPKATLEDNEGLFRFADRGYLVWAVNPRTGEVERHPLSFTWEDPLFEEGSSGAVEWVNDRWVIALANTILVSGDGATWTQVPLEDTFKDSLLVNSLAAGPIGVIATTCRGWGPHDVYFSEDGLKWENTKVGAFHVESAYADDLGFLVVDSDAYLHQVTSSPDGRTWQAKTLVSIGGFEIQNLAASGHTVFLAHTTGALLLTYE